MATIPGAHNFTVKLPQWRDTITYTVGGVAVDLTGYTPYLRVKFATGTTTYSTADGLTVNSSGEVAWDLDISTWADGFVDYDLKVLSSGGDSEWLLEGVLEVRP